MTQDSTSRTQIDHIGIATDDFEAIAALFGGLLDAPLVHEETFDGMRVGFLELDNCYFELLEPIGDEDPIARYLDSNGPGIHHVAIATDDIDAAIETAIQAGVEPIDTEPRPGAWGHEVAFLHPKSTGGVLIEFVEH
ncbi:methylmalonyl-CoA epimerase [Halalkalirubrum salinum]|uniref:methylmalonyl-CoA epimerase n=1 Tax=Halalkalirubrum salinum TaxID=2563889 RepID=UPI0010FB91D8|nr:methylmalonyl-CoA epimerase [Halalkalirubrum salinum]